MHYYLPVVSGAEKEALVQMEILVAMLKKMPKPPVVAIALILLTITPTLTIYSFLGYPMNLLKSPSSSPSEPPSSSLPSSVLSLSSLLTSPPPPPSYASGSPQYALPSPSRLSSFSSSSSPPPSILSTASFSSLSSSTSPPSPSESRESRSRQYTSPSPPGRSSVSSHPPSILSSTPSLWALTPTSKAMSWSSPAPPPLRSHSSPRWALPPPLRPPPLPPSSGHTSTSSLHSALPPPLTPPPPPPFRYSNAQSNIYPKTGMPSGSSHDGSKKERHDCDIFTGEWVPDPNAPYYTNATCFSMHEHQNCMKHGKPDTEFMKWRWKPDGCELPVFDPFEFLEIVRNKSMAFVGDSISRNHVQSLICLLSRAEYPIDVSNSDDERFKRWRYRSHNFTVSALWSPYLVKAIETNVNGIFDLYLDEFDRKWTSQIGEFGYIIVSAGHWFGRPIVFHENNTITGCQYCNRPNVNEMRMFYAYRKAFRTAFQAILSTTGFKGTTFLRSFAPSHFENGSWNKGGNCVRTKPFRRNEIALEGDNFELLRIQREELEVAEMEGKAKGLKFRLIDTTQAMLLRPDGHPNNYGHWPQENVTRNDCVHWCLPGPVDAWNSFLLEMLKIEKGK